MLILAYDQNFTINYVFNLRCIYDKIKKPKTNTHFKKLRLRGKKA